MRGGTSDAEVEVGARRREAEDDGHKASGCSALVPVSSGVIRGRSGGRHL